MKTMLGFGTGEKLLVGKQSEKYQAAASIKNALFLKLLLIQVF